jgi:hypothetical protein
VTGARSVRTKVKYCQVVETDSIFSIYQITDYCHLTCGSKDDALKFLKKYNYRSDVAIDAFFNDPSAMQTSRDAQAKISELFDKYKGASLV